MIDGITIDELGLSGRTRRALDRVKIKTVEEILFRLEDYGIEDIYKIRGLLQISVFEILFTLKRRGVFVDKYIIQYMESERDCSGDDPWQAFYEIIRSLDDDSYEQQSIRKGLFITHLDGISTSLLMRLINKNVVTAEELIEKYDSVEDIDLIPWPDKLELVKALAKCGYRFKDGSEDRYPIIEEYIMVLNARVHNLNELKIDEDIVRDLNRNGIYQTERLIRYDIEDLKKILSEKSIAVLLRRLDEFHIRLLSYMPDEYENVEKVISTKLNISLNDLGFSSQLIKKLESNNIYDLDTLRSYSRQELLDKKIVGTSAVKTIIDVLYDNRTCLSGDEISHCSRCESEYAFVKSSPKDRICTLCVDKMSRIKKVKNFVVTIEEPDYSSYTDGTKGFTLFFTIHNKSKEMVNVELKSVMVNVNNREWASTSYLTGYRFDDEYILPGSSKTFAKIWSGSQFNDMRIEKGDYITVQFSIDDKIYIYKIIRNSYKFELDDYYVVS